MEKVFDFLIVGGSAAGTTTAEVIRGLMPGTSIAIVHDENHEQYSRVLLPHYIRGKVNRDQVILKKPDWYVKQNIELVKGVKAVGLDTKSQRVKVSNGDIYKYGKLLIAIGGYVIKLQAPNSNLKNILYMRTLEDAEEIIRAAKASKKAVVVGGGFIGLEFATSFRVNQVEEVNILVREPYYWSGKLDEESSKVLTNVLEKNGCKVLTNEEIESFEAAGPVADAEQSLTRSEGLLARRVGAVVAKSGKRFEADVVGIGIGIKSDLSWLEGTGIKIGRAIVTNEYLETSLPNVYAVGDCAEFWDVIFERQHIMGNWANATSQGLAVGKTMSGVKTVFETASSYTINFFDGSCSFIGVTDEKFADEIITRGTVAEGKIARIFIKTLNGATRIVGATVINDPAEVGPLTSAVKNKLDIASEKAKLGDPSFKLSDLH